MVRITLLPLMLVAAASWATDSLNSKSLSGLANVGSPAPHIITAGRLQASDIPTIANAGVSHVIDLTTDAESPTFDEARSVQEAGMQYHQIPVSGGDDLTTATVTRFDRLLRDIGSTPTLVHCASSNRVGALAALRAAWMHGRSIEEAVAEGKRWGLQGLEATVRERLRATESVPSARKPAL